MEEHKLDDFCGESASADDDDNVDYVDDEDYDDEPPRPGYPETDLSVERERFELCRLVVL
jgi:hypothetical protein